MRLVPTGMFLLLALPIPVIAEPITTESLLSDMTNLKRLAEFPDPAYTTRQFSSWDRASTGPDNQETWFANADAGQFIRSEKKDGRTEFVMADVDGPGAIVRIWSANPVGTIRIYLDGDEKPAIECQMKDLLGGTYPGLPRPISGEYSRGWNLYFPIPYAKHMKATGDVEKFYYHINYRTYPAGTPVKTFLADDIKSLADRIQAVAKALEHPKLAAEPPKGSKVQQYTVKLGPGDEKQVIKLKGPQAIAAMRLTPSGGDLAAAARNLVLTITFDGEKTVECPIGDFLGMAPRLIPYESLPLGVTDAPGSYGWSHWWMPFQKSAVVQIRNLGEQTVSVDGRVATTEWKWDDKSLLFHARWRIQRDIPTRPFIDWTHLDTDGKGRFVGGHLHFINPVKGWWGEGDEKIYVDDEKFPSTFGTGTEDYYGYAWGNPDRFTHAYHNQPHVDGPGTYGNVSNNRWHIFDDIPFTTHFKFDMEQWEWAEHQKVTRAAVTYWYSRPGGKDQFQPITKEDVKYIPVLPYKPHQVAGVIEGESMPVLEKSAGDVKEQGLSELFSGEKGMRWEARKIGDRLTVGFDVAEAGRRHVILHLGKARDFAQVNFEINGKKAGEQVDLFAPHLVATGEIDLGDLDLQKGQNKLTFEITGANPKTEKNKFVVVLDYLRLK